VSFTRSPVESEPSRLVPSLVAGSMSVLVSAMAVRRLRLSRVRVAY
jgi:hypothetical protein